jgi:hypothetical protein
MTGAGSRLRTGFGVGVGRVVVWYDNKGMFCLDVDHPAVYQD